MRLDAHYRRTELGSATFIVLAVLVGATVGVGITARWMRLYRPVQEVPHEVSNRS